MSIFLYLFFAADKSISWNNLRFLYFLIPCDFVIVLQENDF